jgi:signal transduction histidine kinase
VLLIVHNVGEIPAETLPHLFDPFRFGSGKGSLGLGLWIVQQIVVAHGGSVDVESSATTGTCFRIRLPRSVRVV